MNSWVIASAATVVVLGATVPLSGCGGSETVTVVQTQTETLTETDTVTQTVEAAPDASQSAPSDSSNQSETAGATIRHLGGTGTDAGLAFRATSLREVPSVQQDEYSDVRVARPVAGAKFVTATVTVLNNGQKSVGPFCGGTDAVVVDDRDRNFEPLSETQTSIPNNTVCGEAIQPGFKSSYTLLFQVPKNAKIKALAVWNSDDENDYSGESYVLFRR